MSKPSFRGTIGDWTQADLQNFLQNVGQLTPTQLPPSYSSDQVTANGITIAQSLDFTSGAILTKDGFVIDPLKFVGADFTSAATAMYAETTGTPIMRAGGSTLLAQVADLPDQLDQPQLQSGRIHASALYLPARTTINNIHFFVPVASTASISASGAGIFQAVGAGGGSMQSVATVTGIATGGTFTNIGMATVPLGAPTVLDEGVYYGAVCCVFGAGVPPTLSGKTGTQDLMGNYLNGPRRTAYVDSATPIPSVWVVTGSTAARVWFGLS